MTDHPKDLHARLLRARRDLRVVTPDPEHMTRAAFDTLDDHGLALLPRSMRVSDTGDDGARAQVVEATWALVSETGEELPVQVHVPVCGKQLTDYTDAQGCARIVALRDLLGFTFGSEEEVRRELDKQEAIAYEEGEFFGEMLHGLDRLVCDPSLRLESAPEPVIAQAVHLRRVVQAHLGMEGEEHAYPKAGASELAPDDMELCERRRKALEEVALAHDRENDPHHAEVVSDSARQSAEAERAALANDRKDDTHPGEVASYSTHQAAEAERLRLQAEAERDDAAREAANRGQVGQPGYDYDPKRQLPPTPAAADGPRAEERRERRSSPPATGTLPVPTAEDLLACGWDEALVRQLCAMSPDEVDRQTARDLHQLIAGQFGEEVAGKVWEAVGGVSRDAPPCAAQLRQALGFYSFGANGGKGALTLPGREPMTV